MLLVLAPLSYMIVLAPLALGIALQQTAAMTWGFTYPSRPPRVAR